MSVELELELGAIEAVQCSAGLYAPCPGQKDHSGHGQGEEKHQQRGRTGGSQRG